MTLLQPISTLFPTRRSSDLEAEIARVLRFGFELARERRQKLTSVDKANVLSSSRLWREIATELSAEFKDVAFRSEEHTSELQSHSDLVCRLLLEKKNITQST